MFVRTNSLLKPAVGDVRGWRDGDRQHVDEALRVQQDDRTGARHRYPLHTQGMPLHWVSYLISEITSVVVLWIVDPDRNPLVYALILIGRIRTLKGKN